VIRSVVVKEIHHSIGSSCKLGEGGVERAFEQTYDYSTRWRWKALDPVAAYNRFVIGGVSLL